MTSFQVNGGNDMVMVGIQIFHLLLVLLVLAVVITGAIMLIKVLFKLNKALDIWLKEKEGNGRDAGA